MVNHNVSQVTRFFISAYYLNSNVHLIAKNWKKSHSVHKVNILSKTPKNVDSYSCFRTLICAVICLLLQSALEVNLAITQNGSSNCVGSANIPKIASYIYKKNPGPQNDFLKGNLYVIIHYSDCVL